MHIMRQFSPRIVRPIRFFFFIILCVFSRLRRGYTGRARKEEEDPLPPPVYNSPTRSSIDSRARNFIIFSPVRRCRGQMGQNKYAAPAWAAERGVPSAD